MEVDLDMIGAESTGTGVSNMQSYGIFNLHMHTTPWQIQIRLNKNTGAGVNICNLSSSSIFNAHNTLVRLLGRYEARVANIEKFV